MSSYEGPIIAVLRVFDVVVGIAFERFLKDDRMIHAALRHFVKFRANKGVGPSMLAKKSIYEILYWASFLLLVTLALRFAIGSEVHLKHSYQDMQGSVGQFVKDLAFLVLFGVFLVRAALSAKLTDLLWWLTMFLGTGAIWSLVEILSRPTSWFGCWWLFVNLLQLALTLIVWWSLCRWPHHASFILVLLAVCFAVLFYVDVKQLIEMSG